MRERRVWAFLPLIAAALVTVLASLALTKVYRLQVDRRAEAARADVVDRLGALRARLESALTEPLLVTRGLQADLVEHPDMSDGEFSRLASVLLADYPAIRNLTLARGTVIAAVYPEAGNRAAVGVDYRSRPDQWGTVERAIKTRRPVLAGPVTLVQGGVALIGRVPVFLPRVDQTNPGFFGLISVVIDVPVALATAGVDQETLPIRLAIRGRDGMGAAGGMIWGDEAIFADNAIEMDVMLPGGSWRLAALPKGGWDADHAELQITRLLGVILALIVALASFGTAFYIRSLRLARWRAAESEERYRALVETSPMAVCVHRDGDVIFANPAAVQMAEGKSAADLVGVNIFQQVHPDYRPQAQARVQALMADGGAVPSMEAKLFTLGGRAIDVEVVSARVTMDGRPAVLSLINDITLRHQAEAERENLVQNLQRSNEDLLQFAYIASHDLQEPLRNVSGYVQLLGRRYRGRLDKDADQFIDFAVDGVKRMQELISSLLDYSRLSSGTDVGRPVDCDSVLELVLSDMSAAIARQGGKVEAKSLPRVVAREPELARIFQNLIGNGLKYARAGVPPVISISARRSDADWIISVADNGIGIAEEYHDRIFSMFQRLHARDAYGGTGIGLAICRKLVQHNGGRIWVESREGEGSTFHFTLPAA